MPAHLKGPDKKNIVSNVTQFYRTPVPEIL
jgi:hypothetical protein